jgi:hypothetical protein
MTNAERLALRKIAAAMAQNASELPVKSYIGRRLASAAARILDSVDSPFTEVDGPPQLTLVGGE